MSSSPFLTIVDAALKDAIGAAGFKRHRPGLWNRRSGEELHVVRLQRKRGDDLYCVNLGVTYTFMPSPLGTPIAERHFDEADCEIRRRLTASDLHADQWWAPTQESADEIGRLAQLRALPFFDAYRLPGPLANMALEELTDNPASLLSNLPKARALLLLARIHEHLGDRDRARQAAIQAIEAAPAHATLAVADLRAILKRAQ